MKMKRYLSITAAIVCCLTLFAGCGKSQSVTPADLSYTQTDMGSISIPSNV